MLRKACGGVGLHLPETAGSTQRSLCLNTPCSPDVRVRSERAALLATGRPLRRDPSAWGTGGSAAALRPHPALDLQIEFSSQTDDLVLLHGEDRRGVSEDRPFSARRDSDAASPPERDARDHARTPTPLWGG